MPILHSAARQGLVALFAGATLAHADPVTQRYADNFQGGLANWNDRSPANPQAALVFDPLNAANQVLGFNRLGSGGSVFSQTSVDSPDGLFTLSFDYLGLANARTAVAGDLGGYIGVASSADNAVGFWVGGTGSYGTPLNLVDDGQWHSYSFTWTSGIGNRLQVMAEDWAGSGGVAGDAYFDNVVLRGSAANDVPEPNTLLLVGAALFAAIGMAWRRAGRQFR